jgi:hypothetical protein
MTESMGVVSQEDLPAALRGAREVAERHMVGCEQDGSSWREETISELIWQAARPFIAYADFNRHQEASVGADWLWWWLDDIGECFGMLVQAKRMHRHNGRFVIDFQANSGEQMKRLFRAADLFEVPAIYSLYLGSTKYRTDLRCGPDHTGECERCRAATVSVLTGLQASMAGPSPIDGANEAQLPHG